MEDYKLRDFTRLSHTGLDEAVRINVDLSDCQPLSVSYEFSPLFPRISSPLSLVVYYEEIK
jgi:hypothetical protein